MTITIGANDTSSISLDAFVEHLEHDVHLADVDGLIAAAPAFRQLLNNRRLLTEYIERELVEWRDRTRSQDYIGATLIMVERPLFTIRANIWLTPDPDKPAPKPTDPGFGYLIPHDHNFAFLTGGFHGPGYVTNLFEYDYERVAGVEGAPVELRPCGRDDLPLGKIVLYRPSRDVHYQEHPRELSISLNVMVAGPYVERVQYLFDLETSTVRAAIDPPGTRNATVCELAAALGDAHTATLLGDVASAELNPKIRVAAARALRSLEPSTGNALLEQLRADRDERTRALASS